MTDLLTVSYDYDERNNEKGIVVARIKNDSCEVLKMLLDDKAEMLYKILTEQDTDFEIKEKQLLSEPDDFYEYWDNM